MTEFLLSIDQGTSSSRAMLFDENGRVHHIAQKPIDVFYPQDGWVEHNAMQLVDKTVECLRDLISYVDEQGGKIAGIGLTNQRETTIVWDKNTGQPIYNAIVWQDRRTSDYCDALRRDGLEKTVNQKTGLLIDPYFSATKLKWILDHVDGARMRAQKGELLFGTVDSFLIWHLTGGQMHVTDSTNASRTMLYNIIGHNWDIYLLDLFDIPVNMMPIVQQSVSDFGQLLTSVCGNDLAIYGVAGDQQAALIGQGCLAPGMVKSTYGTGCFIVMNTGDDPCFSDHRLLTTVAYQDGVRTVYALEAAILNAGTALQFLRDNLRLFDDVHDTCRMADQVADNGGVYFVPALTGLGAPYWRADARGVIAGLNRDSRAEHIVRAALEAQAYQTRDLLSLMEADAATPIQDLRIDGGLVSNDFMCRFLTDMLHIAVTVPEVSESTAWGAACLAGVGCGVFDSLEDSATRWRAKTSYTPSRSKDETSRLYALWKKAVEKTYS